MVYSIILLFKIILMHYGYQDSFTNHYSCLKLLNPQIKEGPWTLEQYIDMEDFESFQYYMVEDDTIFNLLYYVKRKNIRLCRSDLAIIEFWKRYSDQYFNYFLSMDTDTFYFYKSPIDHPETKIFTIGKYYYIYTKFGDLEDVKDCQVNFFLEHSDSLKKIRGNYLPELPCNSE